MTDHSLAPILRFVLAERGWPISARLENMARHLPAIASAGLEIPLDREDKADLQQRICKGEQADRLQHFFGGGLMSGPGWRRLGAACSSSLMDSDIEEAWLELDDVEGLQSPPVSVFLKFTETAASRIAQPIERCLHEFNMPSAGPQREALDRCIAACGPEVRISHLGLMLGRSGSPLRLIVDVGASSDIADFLKRAGWPGCVADAASLADRLFVHADRIRLAITLGDEVIEDLGLECFVGKSSPTDPRWRCLLDLLVQMRLCEPSIRDRLTAWPSAITPARASGDWPEPLLVEALARGGDAVGWIDCRLSHVKLSFSSSRPLSAKGYLGFLEIWDGEKATPTRSSPTARTATPAERKEPLEKASAFLLAARTQAGWWIDYDGFSEGPSDEWVTAYVAHALRQSRAPDVQLAARRAWRLLSGRARDGWGWNFLQPADADSTIWALRLAADLGELGCERAQASLAFLRRHMDREGGVATYQRDVYHDWSQGAAINPGWYEAHECVTAAAAGLSALGAAPFEYLRTTQREDGAWSGYWWRDPAYATALAAEAIAAEGAPDQDALKRAVAWAASWMKTALADGTACRAPFQVALVTRVLLLSIGEHSDLLAAAGKALLAGQHPDGSWTASAALSIRNRQGELVPALDTARTLTTATVLQSLIALDRSIEPDRIPA